ncbi:unnamed protein product [Darwinula stevensoni]|uniref:Ran GTPase activating protein 1 n=1 Tax=Darwinula stevensoni TaxID=69355 RepID=A0A7R8X839_9CRUS|nr:unnamed protein product [Darwinula stevensoni]CAG0887535.1 unnamed protein product [Darwinula stevensoni]
MSANVVAAINRCQNLRQLRLQGSIGVPVAKGIAKALESKPTLERAKWKGMFNGRLEREIPVALTHLVDGLRLADAHLVELDLSDNALGSIGAEGIKVLLESPVCFSLQELKLSNNDLGIEGGQIVAAALWNCHVKSVEAGRPLSLKTFYAGRNRLGNRGAMTFAAVFVQIKTLEEVVMPQNRIYHQGVAALAEAFEMNPNLHTINISDNTITPRAARLLKGALAKLPKLKSLNFGDCLLGDKGAVELLEGLQAPHPYLELVKEGLRLSCMQMKGLLEQLKITKLEPCSNTTLNFAGRELKLKKKYDASEDHSNLELLEPKGNSVSVETAKGIRQSWRKHRSLQRSRSRSKDMFTGILKQEIPDALRFVGGSLPAAGAQLIELDLSDNVFGPSGTIGLKILLQSPLCHSLQTLRLNNNELGTQGAQMVSDAILKSHEDCCKFGQPLALKTFICGRNRLKSGGAVALAKVFKVLGSLREVSLPQNEIDHDGIYALAEAFSQNPNLKSLNLNENSMTPMGAGAMKNALCILRSLRILDLGDCQLKTEGTKFIAEALATGHECLEELCLDRNDMDAEGALAVLESLKMNQMLSKLNLDGNHFGKLGCDAIREKLTAMGKIQALLDINQDESGDDGIESVRVVEPEQVDESSSLLSFPVSRFVVGSFRLVFQVIAEAFFSQPSACKFESLGGDKVGILGRYLDQQRHEVEDWVIVQIEFLIGMSSLASEPSIRDEVVQCIQHLLEQIIKSLGPNHLPQFTHAVLVFAGLIKVSPCLPVSFLSR